MPLVNRAGGGGVSFTAFIRVTYTPNSVCTCEQSGIVYTATDTTGSYTFKVKSAGTWTIKVVQGTVNHHLLSLPDQTKRSFAVIGVAGKTYTITVNSQGVLIEGPNDKDQNDFYKYTFPYVMVQFIKDSWQYSST